MALADRARINGAVDTGLNVLDNINKIATTSGCYVTWDPSQGKWNVVINDVGTSVFSFTDSNIISPITLGTRDLDQIYNRVTVQFPHQDLRDGLDTITYRIPDGDQFNGETDNPLNINLELCNDPVQAALIGARELKQSRVDKTITFTADYTANGLVAGEIIDITNSAYGWTKKYYRVISIEEQDGSNGELVFGITAQEYDSTVYSTSGLTREERNTQTEITPNNINECIIAEDGNEVMDNLTDGLNNGNTGVQNNLANALVPAILNQLINNNVGRTFVYESNITVSQLDSFMTTLGTPTGANTDYPNIAGYRADPTTSPWVMSWNIPFNPIAMWYTINCPLGQADGYSNTGSVITYPLATMELNLGFVYPNGLTGFDTTRRGKTAVTGGGGAGTYTVYAFPDAHVNYGVGTITALYNWTFIGQVDASSVGASIIVNAIG